MSKQTIWNTLRHKGFSIEAAAAILGNMEAESNCVSNRVQGDFSEGYENSASYTRMVDEGKISREAFIRSGPGGGGYGLMQWTYPTRKAGLYDLANARGASVGEEEIQLEWFMQELRQEEYGTLREILQCCSSIRQCSDALVRRFLKPADQSEAALQKRSDLARQMFDCFAGSEIENKVNAQPEEDGMVKISEEEFRLYSKAVLVVMTLRDRLKMMEEYE